MKPRDILVCSSIAQMPHVPSFISACACGVHVWVSNTLRARVDAGRLAPTCHQCAAKALIQDPRKAKIHRDQVRELRELGILHVARDVVTGFNRATRRNRRRRK